MKKLINKPEAEDSTTTSVFDYKADGTIHLEEVSAKEENQNFSKLIENTLAPEWTNRNDDDFNDC